MTTVDHAHFIRIRYHGPTNTRGSRLSATWEGWPSDDSRPVRRFFDYTSDRDQMARDVAAMFCAWLSDGQTGLTYSAEHVALATMPENDWALMVRTRVDRTA